MAHFCDTTIKMTIPYLITMVITQLKERKVYRGTHALVITLPKTWVVNAKIEPGHKLPALIDERGNLLLLRSDNYTIEGGR